MNNNILRFSSHIHHIYYIVPLLLLGRCSRNSAYIFPCWMMWRGTPTLPKEKDPLEGDIYFGVDLYVVAIWLTRCASQRVDMIIYDHDNNECFKIDSCLANLRAREVLLQGTPPAHIDPKMVQE